MAAEDSPQPTAAAAAAAGIARDKRDKRGADKSLQRGLRRTADCPRIGPENTIHEK